ncbi:arylesterase [Algihabitans albus]|uniref:arylesterase n=1 Tax=Algihabitans albus TaxID=2164067 RepID=UPI000E5CA09D|nr:arylesterase [Algihabitans albus]
MRILAPLLLALAFAVPAQAEPLKIMAFGDSLVHGYGLPAGEPFPAQLEARLQDEGYGEVTVLNAGNSGDTTAAGLARIGWALADDPDAVIVVLGANDGLRGIEPANTMQNLDGLLEELERAGIPVLLAGMLAPRNLGSDYAEAFDAVFPNLQAKYDPIYYPFFLEGVATVPELNQADGIHPNAEGVATIVENIFPKVEELILRVRERSAAAEG